MKFALQRRAAMARECCSNGKHRFILELLRQRGRERAVDLGWVRDTARAGLGESIVGELGGRQRVHQDQQETSGVRKALGLLT